MKASGLMGKEHRRSKAPTPHHHRLAEPQVGGREGDDQLILHGFGGLARLFFRLSHPLLFLGEASFFCPLHRLVKRGQNTLGRINGQYALVRVASGARRKEGRLRLTKFVTQPAPFVRSADPPRDEGLAVD